MQQIFFTLLTIWFIWRLFGAFSRPKVSSQDYQQSNNNYYAKPKQEDGEVKIDTKAVPTAKIPPT
jgi:hypothetical protein